MDGCKSYLTKGPKMAIAFLSTWWQTINPNDSLQIKALNKTKLSSITMYFGLVVALMKLVQFLDEKSLVYVAHIGLTVTYRWRVTGDLELKFAFTQI